LRKDRSTTYRCLESKGKVKGSGERIGTGVYFDFSIAPLQIAKTSRPCAPARGRNDARRSCVAKSPTASGGRSRRPVRRSLGVGGWSGRPPAGAEGRGPEHKSDGYAKGFTIKDFILTPVKG